MPDNERDQVIVQVAHVLIDVATEDVTADAYDMARALDREGLLRAGGDTSELSDATIIRLSQERDSWKIRATVLDEKVLELRAERDQALSDQESLWQERKQLHADRDRAVAETAALRDAVRELADGSDGLGFVNVHELRALLAETDPDAVRELHANYCDECATDGPCPTILALESADGGDDRG